MKIIVTGAGRGIGYETVRHLSRLPGYTILAVSRDAVRLDELLTACQTDPHKGHSHVVAIPFDLSNKDLSGLLEQIKIHADSEVDILINNAGLLINKGFEELSDDELEDMFNTNCLSIFRLIRTLSPLLQHGGHIVNIGSMGGFQGSSKFVGLSGYSASKAALACLSECLAEELAPRRIAVNCLALGAVQTEMLSQAFPGYIAPLDASEMGRFIAGFATQGNRWFNGKVLPVSLNTPPK